MILVTSSLLDVSIQRFEDICKCAICLDRYVEPKTLPCRHSFCSECLEGLVQFTDDNRTIIKCPICKKPNNFAQKVTISKLKTELTLVQMLDVLNER